MEKSDKDFVATLLLSFFLGGLGIHRFYTGKSNAVWMLLTLGGLGIWALIDFVRILTGTFTDGEGKLIKP